MMNREEFIHEVENRYSKTHRDDLLTRAITEILGYFSSVNSEITNVNENLEVGFNHDSAEFLDVSLAGNHLHFKRDENSISASFVSNKDNQFTKQYEHLPLDTFIVVNDEVVNEKDESPFDANYCEKYLVYLLA